jgi:hypothetical protein
MGGENAGSSHPIQLDEHKRPITAGGFVPTGPVVFEDVSEKAGLTHWTHKMGSADKKYIIETDGSGVGLIDYDNDGWLDIYVVTDRPLTLSMAKRHRLMPRCFTITTMGPLPMWRQKPA